MASAKGAVVAGAAGAPPAGPPGMLGSILTLLGVGQKRTAGVIMEDDEFLKKWSGPILIGPIVPAIVSVFIIVIGEIALNSKKEICNYPLDVFIQAVIAMCYLFLIIFSWTFLGDTITVKLPILDQDWTIFVPFTSLKFLMRIYFLLGFIVFIIFCIGATLLRLAALCVNTSPRMYSLTLFMVAVFWMGFIIVVILLTKLSYGNQIFAFIKEAARAPSQNEFEEKVFRKQFAEFDKNKTSTMAKEDFGAFLQTIGIYIPDNEQPALIRTLDPEDTGELGFDNLLSWFRKVNAAGDQLDTTGVEDDESAKPKKK